jgi:hypothetical protein
MKLIRLQISGQGSTEKTMIDEQTYGEYANYTFDLLHVRQLLFPFVVERLRRDRFVVHTKMSEARQRHGETALAHAAVVPEPAFVYVRMNQRVHDGHTFVLGGGGKKNQQRTTLAMSYR